QSVTPIGENYGISFFHVVHIMNAIGFYEYTNFVRLNIPMGGARFKCYPGPFSSVSYRPMLYGLYNT
ncbi:hypothetical protein, partial [Bacteroides uniformis]|uniref:hypothetical protein n=1 Tax=Bacteroides uniformis TaxID=820 RepID=UPI003BA91205